MAKVILGIHGLGNKPPKDLLESWWRKSMLEGLQRIGRDVELPHFEMVYWADVIYEKPLDVNIKNKSNPYFIDETYVPATNGFKSQKNKFHNKVVSFLGRLMKRVLLNEDFSLNYSFLTDAIMHHYFKDLETYYFKDALKEENEKIRAKDVIRGRLVNTLRKYKDDDICIVAHSMGSIVTFDALTLLAPKVKINTLFTIGSPLGMPVVLSKIASELAENGVFGKSLRTPPGITKAWFNHSDELDNVTFNYRLFEDYAVNEAGIKPVDSIVINDYVMKGVHNPHKSFGYLRTPEFSRQLFNYITKKGIARKLVNSLNTIVDKIQNADQRDDMSKGKRYEIGEDISSKDKSA